MKYKVGDYVRILNNQGQNTLYRKGDVGKIDLIESDGGVQVEFDDGCSWWIWSEGDRINGEELLAEDCFELLDPLSSSTIERQVKDIVFNANSLGHIAGFEDLVLPATKLIEKMLDILKEHGILHELTLPE